MSLSNIAIIGANGHLGPFILDSLLKKPNFNVTVLTRKSSNSSYPSVYINLVTLPDDLPHSALMSALKGQDALIIAVAGSQVEVSKKCIDAAVDAGVKRIIPADFGSCDSSDERTLSLIPLYPQKKDVREYMISKIASVGNKTTWTSLVNGHFLDYGLQGLMMQLDIPKRKARTFDGGDVKFSASMLRTVGEAVVGILNHPAETADKMVYAQSLSTTQNELLAAVEKVTGAKFEVENRNSDEFIKEMQAVLKEKPGDFDTTEDLVGVEGIVNADWTGKETFMNALFELPDEDVVKLVEESLAKKD